MEKDLSFEAIKKDMKRVSTVFAYGLKYVFKDGYELSVINGNTDNFSKKDIEEILYEKVLNHLGIEL